MESSPLTHAPHTNTHIHTHTHTHVDPHKQEYVSHLSESNFKGIVIGGTYQHCFEDFGPVIAPPSGMEKRVIGVNFAGNDHLELRLYLPKDEETKVISLGADWHWINTSPNGYLVSKGLFSSKRKLVCYYLPRHPIEWATESERVGLTNIGLNKVRSSDSCTTVFSTAFNNNNNNNNNNNDNSNTLSINNLNNMHHNENESNNENVRYGNNNKNNINVSNNNSNNNNNNNNNNINKNNNNIYSNNNSNDNIDNIRVLDDNNDNDDNKIQYVDVEMCCSSDLYSTSLDNWGNNNHSSSSLSLPLHTHMHTVNNTHINTHTDTHQNSIYKNNQNRNQQNRIFSSANYTDSNLILENVHCNGDRTDNTVDDEDLLLSSLLRSSNADLNCTHIIVFVLEYLLGTYLYLLFSHLLIVIICLMLI